MTWYFDAITLPCTTKLNRVREDKDFNVFQEYTQSKTRAMVSSYRFDTEQKDSKVIKFDEFKIN